MSEDRSSTQPAGPSVFSAADMKRRMAEREAAKAAEEMRHVKEQEEKQKAVMEELHKPLERTPEQLMQVVMPLVSHAAERGQSEVQVYRFPNAMCSDRGRLPRGMVPCLRVLAWTRSFYGTDACLNKMVSGRTVLVRTLRQRSARF